MVTVGVLVGMLAFAGSGYAADYTVKPGDTLYKIAKSQGTTVDTLTSLNNLCSTMICTGQVLQLPDKTEAQPSSDAQPADSTNQYTVQPGDTIYLISKAYGTTVEEIMSLNNLSCRMIYPGDVLQLPDGGQAPPPEPSEGDTQPADSTNQYTVQPGDTLYLISKAYGTTVEEIMSLNRMCGSRDCIACTTICPGDVLQLPEGAEAEPAEPSEGDAQPADSTNQYTVQPGDTLYLISKAYGTTVEEIMSLNNIYDTTIYPGDLLQLPEGGQAQPPSDGNTEPANSTPSDSTTPSRGSNYSAEDSYLLAQIISAEAAGESYEGQVAVGAVILNRINDPRFPNTLRDVIFEPWQFEPVQNGTIYSPPVSSAISAAEAALNGWDPVNGAVYFLNPDTAQSTAFFATLIYVGRIGNHVFYK
jgi:LysM repeat protein